MYPQPSVRNVVFKKYRSIASSRRERSEKETRCYHTSSIKPRQGRKREREAGRARAARAPRGGKERSSGLSRARRGSLWFTQKIRVFSGSRHCLVAIPHPAISSQKIFNKVTGAADRGRNRFRLKNTKSQPNPPGHQYRRHTECSAGRLSRTAHLFSKNYHFIPLRQIRLTLLYATIP